MQYLQTLYYNTKRNVTEKQKHLKNLTCTEYANEILYIIHLLTDIQNVPLYIFMHVCMLLV